MQITNFCDSFVATAKVKINNKMHYFYSGARKTRQDAMNRIFTLINLEQEIATA
jgi:hypothetical protein